LCVRLFKVGYRYNCSAVSVYAPLCGIYVSAKVMFVNYCEAMSYIESFSKLGKPVSSLARFEKIMAALGNPQKEMNFVHVAGTNGKGSTVRMIAETLTRSGYRTGEFTSPYIRVYNDRIRIDGVNISDAELDYITNAEAGHGLIKIGSSLVPFENDFPKNTKLYKLMSTKPGEEETAA